MRWAIQDGALAPSSQDSYALERVHGNTLTAYAKKMITTYIIGLKAL